MYPSGTREAPVVAIADNIICLFAGIFFQSPLTDSNRRPPPYHGGSGVIRAGTAGHQRSRFSCNRASAVCQPCPRVPARAQPAVPVSYPRTVVYSPNEQQLIRARMPCADPGRCRFRPRRRQHSRRASDRRHSEAPFARGARPPTRARERRVLPGRESRAASSGSSQS